MLVSTATVTVASLATVVLVRTDNQYRAPQRGSGTPGQAEIGPPELAPHHQLSIAGSQRRRSRVGELVIVWQSGDRTVDRLGDAIVLQAVKPVLRCAREQLAA